MKEDRIAQGVAKGIAQEKTRESLAVMMAIGAIILAAIVGSITTLNIGVGLMLVLFAVIWRYYYRPRGR